MLADRPPLGRSTDRFHSLPTEPLTFLQFSVGVTVAEVIQAMGQAQVHCVLLMDRLTIAGIFTATDMIRAIATGADLTTLPIATVMTPGVMTIAAAEAANPNSVIEAFQRHSVQYLPVVSPIGEVLQVLTVDQTRQLQIRQQTQLQLRSKQVREAITPQVLQIAPDQTLQQAAKILSYRHADYLVVTALGNRTPIGVLTKGDLIQAQMLGFDFVCRRVQDVMSAPPRAIGLEDSLWNADEMMQRHFLRRLVIVNQQGELAGLLEQDSILRLLDPIALHQTTQDLQQEVTAQAILLEEAYQYRQQADFELRRLRQELLTAHQEIERFAYLDNLTQTCNRRYFDQLLSQEWQRLRRDKQPLAIVLADIDFFQEYNNHYGRSAGDDCLKQLAIILAESTQRSSDTISRYGGEEFAILLPNTDLAGAILMTERVQQMLISLRMPHASSSLSEYVTLSFGLATCVPSFGASFADLLTAADRAMYRAKEQGRNTYRVAVENEFSTKPRFKILEPAEMPII
jgi:diguanylate cyclase (GGDEF)-like protein